MAIFERMLVKIADRRIKGLAKEGVGCASVGDAVYFGLESISKGSAVVETSVMPRLGDSRAEQVYAGFELDPVSCVKDAFRVLMEILHGSRNEDSVEYFKIIENDMKSFGKNLKRHEMIRFAQSEKHGNSDIAFNASFKRELVASRKIYSRVVGTGVLTGFRLNGTVFVHSREYGAFSCKTPTNAVKVGLDGHIGSEIEFVLSAVLNHHGKIERVEKRHRLRLVINEESRPARVDSVLKRLDEFNSLEKGWHEGEGVEIDLASINMAKKFTEMTTTLAHKYIVAPDPRGFAAIEFAHEGWSIGVDFLADGVNASGFDLAGKLGCFERSFMKLDSNLVEFVSTAGGNLNASDNILPTKDTLLVGQIHPDFVTLVNI